MEEHQYEKMAIMGVAVAITSLALLAFSKMFGLPSIAFWIFSTIFLSVFVITLIVFMTIGAKLVVEFARNIKGDWNKNDH